MTQTIAQKGRWPQRTPIQRFWSKTVVSGHCLIWRAGINRGGYGTFRARKPDGSWTTALASRWIYEQVLGPVKPGLVVMHSCDNPRCVTLQHLSIGSDQQNVHDCIAKGRQAVGLAMPHAKLSDDQVRQIRALRIEGLLQREIAERFGVSRELVREILRGRKKQHVK